MPCSRLTAPPSTSRRNPSGSQLHPGEMDNPELRHDVFKLGESSQLVALRRSKAHANGSFGEDVDKAAALKNAHFFQKNSFSQLKHGK